MMTGALKAEEEVADLPAARNRASATADTRRRGQQPLQCAFEAITSSIYAQESRRIRPQAAKVFVSTDDLLTPRSPS